MDGPEYHDGFRVNSSEVRGGRVASAPPLLRPSASGRRPTRPLARLREAIDDASRKSPARFAILIFTTLILLFTAIFMLPISSADGEITPVADSSSPPCPSSV
ncbi:hypothetical protein GCM10025867_40310 [Frondihabitans sucicola]|uniref:Oligopeptide transport permease C-like N-terminal domain-containing protein n=1 Tax=Frondihabitans sucicola TaxID=1268041 RepID=A0ABM8GTI8_9MICO|nr:hypothetical protein GCM10025867_40310 [Frondihabitans sucicola]